MQRVIVIALLLCLSLGGVVYMATHPSGSATTSTAEAEPGEPSANGTQLAEGPKKPVMTPDITKISPYEFLDLLPEGKKAPEFSVKDARGHQLTLDQFKGKSNVVLIFYQGSFCSVCAHQLAGYQRDYSKFKTHNTEIVAISADDATHAKKTLGEQGISFHVVPNAEKDLIKKFGAINVTRDIAYPVVYLLDKQGKVRFSFADREGTRFQSDAMLKKVEAL